MGMRPRILVVDDEPGVVTWMTRRLTEAGYEVQQARDGSKALKMAMGWRPDVVILDVALSGRNGFEVYRRLRSRAGLSNCRVLCLTAMELLKDWEAGLDAGGDDVLTRPFTMEELLWRVRALLRRGGSGGTGRLQVGPVLLNSQTGEVWVRDRKEQLTPRECDLLGFLMRSPLQPFTCRELLQQVWGYPPGIGCPALVRTHIRNVRRKIEPDPRHPVYLVNIPCHGYMCCGE